MSEVHQGTDGWLFLVGGSNNVFALYTDPNELPEETVAQWAEEIKRRSRLAHRIGARFLHLVAPEKLAIYQRHVTLPLPDQLESPGRRLADLLEKAGESSSLLYLTDFLRTEARSRQLFMKTDTHWTYEGIGLVHSKVCERLGMRTSESVENREVIKYRGVFDLGGKFQPPIDEETIHLPFLEGITRVYANRVAEMWDDAAKNGTPVLIHNSLHVIYKNSRSSVTDAKVMLFGDSFLDFRPTTLASMFIEQFRETHIVWSNSIDENYINEVHPDILVTENAERFMRSVPSTGYNVQLDAAKRVAALDKSS